MKSLSTKENNAILKKKKKTMQSWAGDWQRRLIKLLLHILKFENLIAIETSLICTNFILNKWLICHSIDDIWLLCKCFKLTKGNLKWIK